ncbi:MAG: mechanosensitive ion channel family protein, partial [Alphaproteobacteria bacterium]
MDLKDFTTLDWFFAGQVGIVIAAYILSRIMKMFLNPVQNGILIVALLFAAWAGLHYFEVPTAVIKLAAFVTLTTFLCYYIYETTQLSFAALFLSMYVIIFMGLVGLDWHLDAQKLLNSYALQIGDYRISILFVLKVLFLVLFVHWLIGLFMEWFKRRVKSSRTMDNSQKLLLSRIIFVALYALAIISVLNVLGFDTATLAVFTGAIGLGVGIGLQSIASQIISGYILLFHKSVKPGDVIAVAGTYGEVRKMNTLYTSVITRDGKEHLIPNEDLINKPVENWSFSNSLVRLPIRVG